MLWLYRRVFSPQRWAPFDIIIMTLIVVLVCFYATTTLIKIFECDPRAKILDPTLPGSCVSVSMLLNASGMFNTITDILILLLPVHAVTKLKLSPKKKLLLVLVFTFGLWCANCQNHAKLICSLCPAPLYSAPSVSPSGCASAAIQTRRGTSPRFCCGRKVFRIDFSRLPPVREIPR